MPTAPMANSTLPSDQHPEAPQAPEAGPVQGALLSAGLLCTHLPSARDGPSGSVSCRWSPHSPPKCE